MSGRYAIVVEGVVQNIIAWDGETEYDVKQAGYGNKAELMALDDDSLVAAGYLYSGGKFSAPPLTQEQQDAKDASEKARNAYLKSTLMNEANQKISVLQDAVDLDLATESEAASLTLWKKYRVLLSRVDDSKAAEPNWPAKP